MAGTVITPWAGHDSSSQIITADIWQRIFSGGGEGVLPQDMPTGGAVTSHPADMALDVAQCRYLVGGAFGILPSSPTLTPLCQSNPSNPRWALVVIRRINATDVDELDIVHGTAAATPLLPALTRTGTGPTGVHEIALAAVLIPANATNGSGFVVVDLRRNPFYCNTGEQQPFVKVVRTTDMALTSGVVTPVVWQGYQYHDYWPSTQAAPSNLSGNVAWASGATANEQLYARAYGIYRATLNVTITGSTGVRIAMLRLNSAGTAVDRERADGVINGEFSLSATFGMLAGYYVDVAVFADGGGSPVLKAGSSFSLERIWV